MSLVNEKKLLARTILFDSWYSSWENLKLFHQHHGWALFITPQQRPLKSNRLVSPDIESGHIHLADLLFSPQELLTGKTVKLKKYLSRSSSSR
jgi:hypothetical protein